MGGIHARAREVIFMSSSNVAKYSKNESAWTYLIKTWIEKGENQRDREKKRSRWKKWINKSPIYFILWERRKKKRKNMKGKNKKKFISF
jgi:hypothetical protein